MGGLKQQTPHIATLGKKDRKSRGWLWCVWYSTKAYAHASLCARVIRESTKRCVPCFRMYKAMNRSARPATTPPQSNFNHKRVSTPSA